jgi:hypothetical protein
MVANAIGLMSELGGGRAADPERDGPRVGVQQPQLAVIGQSPLFEPPGSEVGGSLHFSAGTVRSCA